MEFHRGDTVFIKPLEVLQKQYGGTGNWVDLPDFGWADAMAKMCGKFWVIDGVDYHFFDFGVDVCIKIQYYNWLPGCLIKSTITSDYNLIAQSMSSI